MKIGFIGGGRMAMALSKGFISAGLATAEEIIASFDPAEKPSAEAFKALGAKAIFEVIPVVERSEVVIIIVKADLVEPALNGVKDLPSTENKLFISAAIRVTTVDIEKHLPPGARVMRVMPNTPTIVRRGAAAICRGSTATSDDVHLTTKLFNTVGTCDEVPEFQMNAITALIGSGPAFLFMMIESLADGGVLCGIPRDLALRLAAQTTLGAATMVKKGGHPSTFKASVIGPTGATAASTHHLEQNGFRAAVVGALKLAAE